MAVLLLGGGVVGFDQLVLLDSGPASAAAAETTPTPRDGSGASLGQTTYKVVSVSRTLDMLRDRMDADTQMVDAFAIPAAWRDTPKPSAAQAVQAAVRPEGPISVGEFVTRHTLAAVEQRMERNDGVHRSYQVAVFNDGTTLRVAERIDGYQLEMITSESVRLSGPGGTVNLSPARSAVAAE